MIYIQQWIVNTASRLGATKMVEPLGSWRETTIPLTH